MTAQKRSTLWVLPLFGAALLWYATGPFRAGISPDTMAFLNVAHHLQAGEGFSAYYPLYSDRSQPLAAWPPLFPALMWSGMPFGIHPLDTAWIANIVFFAVNLWLAGRIVARSTNSISSGWAIQIFFILFTPWRSYFAWALSEPLFLIFVQTAVLFFLKFLESGRDRDWRISALCVGCCEITRYIGGLYIPAFSLAILLYMPASGARRLKMCVRFFILSSVLPSVWAVRNYLRLSFLAEGAQSWADRVFGSLIHREGNVNSLWYNARSMMDAVAAWVGNLVGRTIIEEMNLWAVAIPFLVLTGLAAAKFFKWREAPSRTGSASALLGLLALFYAVGLFCALSFSLFAGPTPVRYLFPTITHLAMLIAVLAFGKRSDVRPAPVRWMLRLLGLAFLAWSVWFAADAVRWTQQVRVAGVDETRGVRWKAAREKNWFPTPELVEDFRRRHLYQEQALGRSF